MHGSSGATVCVVQLQNRMCAILAHKVSLTIQNPQCTLDAGGVSLLEPILTSPLHEHGNVPHPSLVDASNYPSRCVACDGHVSSVA